MENGTTLRDVQIKILEIMKYIDALCRKNEITYFIMGGTALGALRHGGFIPWDDDLDIFMTPDNYQKFKRVFQIDNSDQFILQEWKVIDEYLEYAKVRMNGTTFIEHCYKDRFNIHQGIYVDIMILHKVPDNRLIQRVVYYESRFVVLYALSQRNWSPKTGGQKLALNLLKILPCRLLSRICYRRIYQYDNRTDHYCYCYFITKVRFRQGVFDKSFFNNYTDIKFEDTMLMASAKTEEYLKLRYGDYMKLPPESEREAAVHAYIYDKERNYDFYIKNV